MRVGELANRAMLAPHVVRYYIRVGLLRPRRGSNGYAEFDESDLTRLVFIRKAQRLGFTLNEIGGLLARHDEGEDVCAQVRSIGRQRKAEKSAELRELRRLNDRLRDALRRWRHSADSSPNDPSICPLIMELTV